MATEVMAIPRGAVVARTAQALTRKVAQGLKCSALFMAPVVIGVSD